MNNEEFEQFVLDNGKDILRFCRITTCDQETGNELYQETMLKLLEKCKHLDLRQNVKSYALSISILLWKNQKKKYANRGRIVQIDSIDRLETEENRDITDASSATPEETLLKADEQNTVRRIVGNLPERYRLPIQFFYSADLSILEIADIMKIPEGTVKSRIHKAKCLIKKELEALGYDR